jgi:hypothetical protein
VLGHLNQFLALTNTELNTLVPSLLLGQQYQYPNDQLTVATDAGLQTDREWDGGFRWYDPNTAANGFHGFGAIGVMCGSDPPGGSGQKICPGNNKGYGPGPQSMASQGGEVALASMYSGNGQNISGALQSALLSYLLGQ